MVVTDIGFPLLDVGLIGKFSMGRHDPDDNLKASASGHLGALGWHLFRKAFERGAVGFIGILKDQPGGSCRMYAPYGFKEKEFSTNRSRLLGRVATTAREIREPGRRRQGPPDAHRRTQRPLGDPQSSLARFRGR